MALLKMDLSKMLLLSMAVLAMSQCSVEARVHGETRLRLRRDDAFSSDDYALDQGDNNKDYMDTDDGENDDDEEENNTNGDTADNVVMKSIGRTLEVKLGESIWLHCETDNPDQIDVVKIWRKNNDIIYQGKIKINSQLHKNIERFDNQTLLIKNISESDAGNYTCNVLVSTGNTPTVNYIVNVLTPAKIVQTLPTDDKRRIAEGHPVEIVCNTMGYPKPTLIWSKNGTSIQKNNKDGIQMNENSLYIASAKKEHAGTYQCIAQNKVTTKPAHNSITIQVLFAPIVHIHREIVHGAEGMGVELSCRIHGEPGSVISWLKDGREISDSDSNLKVNLPTLERDTQHGKQKSVLKIIAVSSSDFGTYTCRAKNAQGAHSRSIKLVQHPVIFPAIGADNSPAKLRWTVHSRDQISHVDMQYRKINTTNPIAAPADEDWEAVEGPEEVEFEQGVRLISSDMKFPEGTYEARARVANKHGFSQYATYFFKGDDVTSNDYRAPNVEGEAAENKSMANKKTAATIFSTVVMCLLVRLA